MERFCQNFCFAIWSFILLMVFTGISVYIDDVYIRRSSEKFPYDNHCVELDLMTDIQLLSIERYATIMDRCRCVSQIPQWEIERRVSAADRLLKLIIDSAVFFISTFWASAIFECIILGFNYAAVGVYPWFQSAVADLHRALNED